MLLRKAEKEILSWIQTSNTALLVSGARQVGKTWSIRNCLRAEGCDYLEINLIEEPELIPAIAQCSSVSDLVVMLSAAKNYSFTKGKTILFIDEVQELKEIVTKIKFWVDEGSFRYVLSGSLLGIELRSVRSAPVGYLSEVEMFPLDFEEFLSASGVTLETIQYLHTCFDEQKPVEEIIHMKMLQHFQRYLVVGGMPAAVQEYVNSGDISKVSTIQRNIIEFYKLDFTRYEDEDKKLNDYQEGSKGYHFYLYDTSKNEKGDRFGEFFVDATSGRIYQKNESGDITEYPVTSTQVSSRDGSVTRNTRKAYNR